MYLMDAVLKTCSLFGEAARKELTIQGYLALAGKLQGTPRYLLDSAACRTAVEISLGRPKIIREAMTHIHIPYSRLWVEWDDTDRQQLREKLGQAREYTEMRPMPGRVGFLLEVEEGRRGSATWAWSTPGGTDIPNIGPVRPHFDLDQIFSFEQHTAGFLKGNLARFWEDSPVQLEALFDIWRTSRHTPDAWASAFWSKMADPSLAASLSYSDVVGEYIMIWAVMLMLTASRQVVDFVPVSLHKLNKQRKKRGATPPLLDYTKVSLHLTPREQQPIVRGALGYARKSPRIHMVSSYLARRGSKHWLVSPYFRGSGDTIHRVITVRG